MWHAIPGSREINVREKQLMPGAFHGRSEPAREKRPDNAHIQVPGVIVDVHREQARSYRRNAYSLSSHKRSLV
uniref:hypothetical protein n=1 Tax=Pseudomonas mohnii TaxID=395600 RepID=UPI001A7F0C0C